MKTLLNIILGSTILFSFAQCGSSKEIAYILQEETTFKVVNASYQGWVAGVAGGGSGVNVFFSLYNLDTDKIVVDSIFFRGQKTKVEIKNTLFIGRFKTQTNQRPDIIMSSQMDDEYGNKVPVKLPKFPFELENNEAVVGYKEKGKQKYLKLKLQKKESPLYQ